MQFSYFFISFYHFTNFFFFKFPIRTCISQQVLQRRSVWFVGFVKISRILLCLDSILINIAASLSTIQKGFTFSQSSRYQHESKTNYWYLNRFLNVPLLNVEVQKEKNVTPVLQNTFQFSSPNIFAHEIMNNIIFQFSSQSKEKIKHLNSLWRDWKTDVYIPQCDLTQYIFEKKLKVPTGKSEKNGFLVRSSFFEYQLVGTPGWRLPNWNLENFCVFFSFLHAWHVSVIPYEHRYSSIK